MLRKRKDNPMRSDWDQLDPRNKSDAVRKAPFDSFLFSKLVIVKARLVRAATKLSIGQEFTIGRSNTVELSQ